MSIKVVLIGGKTAIPPLSKVKFAANTCYQASVPPLGSEETNKVVEFVKNNLFLTGHHTTMEHDSFSFFIEDIPVSDVTLGMHLTHPFYNSDQRSGRYCSKMFENPDFISVREHILSLWPECSPEQIENALCFVRLGNDIFTKNIQKAIQITSELLRLERPGLSEKAISERAPKIAQEQLRVFLSTIFPTGLIHTIDLITLVSMWESAWSPGMRKVTDMMKDEVLKLYPHLSFMFSDEKRRKTDWSCKWLSNDLEKILVFTPRVSAVELNDPEIFADPEENLMHPVDLLHFTPEMMDNNIGNMNYRLKISLATMGQDQRHRTVRRGLPIFTGEFYLPPVCKELGIEDQAEHFFRYWKDLKGCLPSTLHTAIAPYGTVVSYRKQANFNAWLHESAKRFCWQAQEEIYNLNVVLRGNMEFILSCEEQNPKDLEKIMGKMVPPCFHSGVCAEGARRCGRDMKCRESKFRKV